MSPDLPLIPAQRKAGIEPFHDGGVPRGIRLADFWSWSASDLVSNATRGILAEYIVGVAIRAVSNRDVRDEWADFDLTTPSGVKVEVKSSSYVQAWFQKDYSNPTFSVKKTESWSAETSEIDQAKTRQAEVYVFALLKHKDQNTIDPMDLTQWAFHVAPTSFLDRRTRSQQSITVASLDREIGATISCEELAAAVEAAAKTHRAAHE